MAYFELLDKYAREQHGCFVAEFFLSKAGSEYIVCFRLSAVSKDSPQKSACRYVRFQTADLLGSTRNTALSDALRRKLDRELSALSLLDEKGGASPPPS
jgi:hypothetical protein